MENMNVTRRRLQAELEQVAAENLRVKQDVINLALAGLQETCSGRLPTSVVDALAELIEAGAGGDLEARHVERLGEAVSILPSDRPSPNPTPVISTIEAARRM